VVGVVTYTVQQLEANISALEGTLARGELTVEYSDRRVTYRAVAELERALLYFKRLLAEVSGPTRSKLSYAVASKGLA